MIKQKENKNKKLMKKMKILLKLKIEIYRNDLKKVI